MVSRRTRLALLAAALAVVAAVALVARRGERSGEHAAPTPDEVDARTTARAVELAADVQTTWAELLRRRGRSYSEARLVPFRGVVRSECGWDERATAPFYCPADERLYLDLDVAGTLLARGEAGDAALAYVVAHAIGHHVQALTGVERRVRRDQRAEPAREAELAIALELQADCFAGVWSRASASRRLDEESAAAALSVVSDVVERRPPGPPDAPPESWLHATRDARLAWFRRGLAAGDPDACDAFSEPPRP